MNLVVQGSAIEAADASQLAAISKATQIEQIGQTAWRLCGATHSDAALARATQLAPDAPDTLIAQGWLANLGHRDYARVIVALREAVARFAEGVYVVWYPQVSKLEAAQLPKKLEGLAPKGWLHARLTVQQPDSQGFGLAGSGVFVINPPFTLHDELLAVLPWLTEVLGQYDGANYLLEQRAA